MRLRADTIIGAILVGFVVILLTTTFYLPPAPYGTVGPAFFPRILLLVMLPMCLALLLKGLVQDLRERREAGRPISEWLDDYRNVIVSYVLFFLFALALPYVGYLISGFIFLMATQVALGPKTVGKMLQHLLVTVIVLGGLYFLFQIMLRVFLPEGELF